MRQLLLPALTACLLAGAGCKKDGVNKNLNPDNQRAVDFMSTKSGTYWKYGSRDGVNYTRYARGRDTVKNGKTFSYYEREDAGGNMLPEYFGKNNEYYLMLIDLDGSKKNYLDYVFWKDSSRLNDRWSNTGDVHEPTIGKIAVLIESQEVENNLTMEWGGQKFTNVVHVHSDAKATAFNVKVATFDFWFVRGLGVIRQETDVDVIGLYKIRHIDSLTSYHIEE